MEKKMLSDDYVQLIYENYEISDKDGYSELSFLLTPIDELNSESRYARARLYKVKDEEIYCKNKYIGTRKGK